MLTKHWKIPTMKPMMRPGHKIRAAEGPRDFRIVLSAAVGVMGLVLLFVDLRLGIPVLGGCPTAY